MCDWEGVTDVNALKAMLAAQQAQLQELQTKDSDKSGNRNASKKKMATRKRKSQPVVDDDFEFEALVSEDEQQQEVSHMDGAAGLGQLNPALFAASLPHALLAPTGINALPRRVQDISWQCHTRLA